jgi:hypothetical protein
MDETWVNQNHCIYYMWLPNDGYDAPKIPSGKGKVYPRSMRVRVSLDFDILIESFISLCIIETVGAIFCEYKPWIVLLITQ